VSAAAIYKVKCRYCGVPRSPREFVVNAAVGYCLSCYENHSEAMAFLASGRAPKACHRCMKPVEELAAANGDLTLRGYMKDGIYQLLCGPCGDWYERKHLPMFVNTPHGQKQKLAGAK
jgi:hypothetical protein